MKAIVITLTCIAAVAMALSLTSYGQTVGSPAPPPALRQLPAADFRQPFADPLVRRPGFIATPSESSRNLLPPAALEVVAQHDKEAASVRQEARAKVGVLRNRLVLALKELQGRYTREAQLDPALVIRDCLRTLGDADPKERPDPGSLTRYASYIDRVGFFRVTGASAGSIYGTYIYTTDSSLAAAAVHAGVLKTGETGLVKVTILPGCASYEGSILHGMRSSSWHNYPASYRVEPVRPEEEKDIETQSDLPLVPEAGPAPGPWQNTPGTIATAGLPDDALKLVEGFQAESAIIQEEAEQKLKRVRREIIVQLKPMMTNYAHEVKLDEAVAVRDYIRSLSQAMSKVLTDPWRLNIFPPAQGTLYFRVTGRSDGIIFGTDVYTTDSALATAAVHADALKEGQTGVVKVTILPRQNNYQGTTRNGITSRPYGPYPGSYKVEAAEEEEPGEL